MGKWKRVRENSPLLFFLTLPLVREILTLRYFVLSLLAAGPRPHHPGHPHDSLGEIQPLPPASLTQGPENHETYRVSSNASRGYSIYFKFNLMHPNASNGCQHPISSNI